MANRTYLEITDEGSQTLEFFGNRINPSIRQEIDDYLKDNSMKLRNESAILGDYKKTAENEYTVVLMIKENNKSLLDIKLSVPTEEMAQAMIDNFQKQSQDIYQYLFSRLMEN
jgi:hypothetical protein